MRVGSLYVCKMGGGGIIASLETDLLPYVCTDVARFLAFDLLH